MPEMAYLCWKIVMIRYRINDEKKLKIKKIKKVKKPVDKTGFFTYNYKCASGNTKVHSNLILNY